MNLNRIQENQSAALPPALAALFADVPKVEELDLKALRSHGELLHDDPRWQADSYKGFYVNLIAEAMGEEGLSQAEVAEKWSKSPQYLSKLLSENKRVNFTVETMVQLAHLVNRRLEPPVLTKPERRGMVVTCLVPHGDVMTTWKLVGCSRSKAPKADETSMFSWRGPLPKWPELPPAKEILSDVNDPIPA